MHESQIASVVKISACRFKEPKRRVHCVVFRRFTCVGKPVGQHTLIHVLRERAQNAASNFRLASRQSKAGQSDHGVAAPIAEPVIASDDGLLVATGHDVLIGSIDKVPSEANRPATIPLHSGGA